MSDELIGGQKEDAVNIDGWFFVCFKFHIFLLEFSKTFHARVV